MAEVWKLVGGSIKAKWLQIRENHFCLFVTGKRIFFVKLFTAKVVSGFKVVCARGPWIKHKM